MKEAKPKVATADVMRELDRDGAAFSVDQLCKRLACSENHMRRLLGELRAAGKVETSRLRGPRNVMYVSWYSITEKAVSARQAARDREAHLRTRCKYLAEALQGLLKLDDDHVEASENLVILTLNADMAERILRVLVGEESA